MIPFFFTFGSIIWFFILVAKHISEISKELRDTKQDMNKMVDKIVNKDKMSDDDIHDILASLTNRLVLNWYDKDHMEHILGKRISDTCWYELIRRQDSIAQSVNDLVHRWASTVYNECNDTEEEDTHVKQHTLKEALESLSNTQLRMYAGVVTTGKTKADLISIILDQFNENTKHVVNKKLEKLSTLLN